jgi:hypothetical protein
MIAAIIITLCVLTLLFGGLLLCALSKIDKMEAEIFEAEIRRRKDEKDS